jgi:hypothetical protein
LEGDVVMSVEAAQVLVGVAAVYLAAGLAFAVPFAWRGVDRLDPLAHGSTPGFRVLIVPGVAMLWPLLAVRLFAGASEPPEEWTAHRATARRTDAPAGGGRR